MPDPVPAAAPATAAPAAPAPAPAASTSTQSPAAPAEGTLEAALAHFAPTSEGVSQETEASAPPPDGTAPEAPAQTQQPAEPLPDAKELSNAFAAYKRKHKALVADREALTKREAEFKAREEALAKRETELNQTFEEGRTNPIAALTKLGYSKEQVLEFLASDGKIPHDVLLKQATEAQKAELEAIKKDIEAQKAEQKRRETEAAEQRRQQDLRGFEHRVGTEIVDILTTPDGMAKYPVLLRVAKKSGPDALRAVLNNMAQHYMKEKKPLAISDAMMQAERAFKAHAEIFVDLQPQTTTVPDPRQAGAVEPANPGSIEPIPANSSTVRGVVKKKTLDEMDDDERWEVAMGHLTNGAAQ